MLCKLAHCGSINHYKVAYGELYRLFSSLLVILYSK